MFTGCGTAMVTPFHEDLSLDESTLRSLVRRQARPRSSGTSSTKASLRLATSFATRVVRVVRGAGA